MDIDELRRLIRAAVLAMPLAGCGAGEPAEAPLTPEPTETVEVGAPLQPVLTGDAPTEAATEVAEVAADPALCAEERAHAEAAKAETNRRELERQQWMQRPVRGRPLLMEAGGAGLVATLSSARSWAEEPRARLGLTLPPELRARVRDGWCDAALDEHASVASFARAALELMAVGAPAALIDAHLEAGRDELRHATRCFEIAAAYGAEALAPGPLEVPGPRAGGLAAVARNVLREGCINETIAALVAERTLRRAQPEPVRAALAMIAEDEAGHAALAWRTVRWAVRRDPSLRAALRRALPEASAIDAPRVPDEPTLAMHGLLEGRLLAVATRVAVERVALPIARDVLA